MGVTAMKETTGKGGIGCELTIIREGYYKEMTKIRFKVTWTRSLTLSLGKYMIYLLLNVSRIYLFIC